MYISINNYSNKKKNLQTKPQNVLKSSKQQTDQNTNS